MEKRLCIRIMNNNDKNYVKKSKINAWKKYDPT